VSQSDLNTVVYSSAVNLVILCNTSCRLFMLLKNLNSSFTEYQRKRLFRPLPALHLFAMCSQTRRELSAVPVGWVILYRSWLREH